MYRVEEVAERVGVQGGGAEVASVDLDQAEDDEEVQKIIGALQLRKTNKIENFEKKIEENIPKIFEISYKKPFNLSSSSFESQLQILSPVFQQKNLNIVKLPFPRF